MKPIKILYFTCLAVVLFCLLIWLSAAATAGLLMLAQNLDGPTATFLTDKGPARIMRRFLFVGIIIIFSFSLKKIGWRGWKDCGWARENEEQSSRLVQFGRGTALGFISLGSIAFFTIFTGLHQFKPTDEHYPVIIGNIIFFCLSGLVVALIEETICRGILFRVFARTWRAWPAAIIISILFADAHFIGPSNAAFQGGSFVSVVSNAAIAAVQSVVPPPDALIRFLNLALLGILLCAFVMRTKTIWMSAGAHAAWVFIIKLHSYCTDFNPAAGQSIWLGKRNDFMDSLAVVFIFILLILLTHWKNKNTGLPVKIRGRLWHIYHAQGVVLPSEIVKLDRRNGNSIMGGTAFFHPWRATCPPSLGLKFPDVKLQNFLQTGEDFFSTGNVLKAYRGCRVVAKENLVLKKYQPKNFLNGIRFAFRPPKTRRAFIFADILINSGLTTPPILAWSADRRFGLLVSESMIVSEVLNAEPLTLWLERKTADAGERMKVMQAYGNLMADFHRHGYSNRDLKHENVMCSKEKPWLVSVIDLDGVRKHLFISRRRAGRDLRRVGKSLAALGWTNETDINAFFEAYNRQVPARLRRNAFPEF